MMLDTNFPGKKKQPDSAFIPNPQPNPNNLLANLIQLQPILGEPWPTIVLEVGNSKPISKLIKNRNKFLGHTTQVNVFVGVSYNRNTSRQTDSWWMCVAHRDIHAPQPPPAMVPEYPPPIIVGELHKTASNGYPCQSAYSSKHFHLVSTNSPSISSAARSCDEPTTPAIVQH